MKELNKTKKQVHPKNVFEVDEKDLPISCPRPHKAVWNSHPKVFLSLEKTGAASCPYCGAQFVLRKT